MLFQYVEKYLNPECVNLCFLTFTFVNNIFRLRLIVTEVVSLLNLEIMQNSAQKNRNPEFLKYATTARY